MLLQWVVLEPLGPTQNLSAVRFSSPVRIRSLRIFPTGARPFKLQDDIVAITEPSSFYLDVYFNAVPVNSDSKNKAKPSNALVPTSIAYQGGQVDFTVDSGNVEFATRLMIIRGKFEKLSLAVYGDIISETLISAPTYESRQLPLTSYSALPPAFDPANSVDPTELAQSLLTLVPDSPGLPLIIRLMFCLKPSNEDWEEKDFPHLYSDLKEGLSALNLEKAVEMTARPVSDTVNESTLKTFAIKLGETINEYNDDEAYLLAKLLSQCAPQHPLLVRFIIENVDLARMYTVANLDRPTLLYLLDAAASLDVSRRLNNQHTLNAISFIRDNSTYDDGARRAANRLFERVKGWEVLEDSLSNTQSPFGDAAITVKEIAAEENSFGIWLENMISNSDVIDRIFENSSPEHPLPCPPTIWQNNETTSHDGFITFLRAVVGVAAVVAVYAWSDSVPVEGCRERTLAVLRLWQNINGYKQIVNHLMLMRQMAYRLECMLPLDDDLPSQAGIDAEHILKALAAQPSSMLRADFVKVMQNLQAPLNYITDDEVLELKRASSMAKDGLSGAVRLLTRSPDKLDSAEKRLDIGIAIAIVEEVIRKQVNGERQLLEALWSEGYNGLPIYLIQHLAQSSTDLQNYFSLDIPLRTHQGEIAAVFQTCLDLLVLLMRLLMTFPVSNRYLASLACSTADLFVFTDSADIIYAQESDICAAAHAVRQACVDIITVLVLPPKETLQVKRCGEATVLKALFTHASAPGKHDAAHHATQVFWLLDHVLPFGQSATWGHEPEKNRRMWVCDVLSAALPELQDFYRVQECDNKVHLLRRFEDLDRGSVGVAEWLLLGEQQVLNNAIALVKSSSSNSLHQHIAHWKVTNSVNVLSAIVQSTAGSTGWAIDALLKDDENVMMLRSNLESLSDTNYFYEGTEGLVGSLAPKLEGVDRGIWTLIVSTLCRAVRCGRMTNFEKLLLLFRSTDEPLFDERSTQEFGEALEEIATSIRDKRDLPPDLAEIVFQIMEKNTPLDNSLGVFVLRGLSEESLNVIMDWASESLPIGESTKLEAMRTRWTIAGKPRAPPKWIPSTYALEMSFESWESLLSPLSPIPSTPTRRSPAQSAEMLGLITVSPPNSLLRSPEVKGLTKTYSNNDFRQLRQLTASRQNTSRLPSTHVDDFGQGSSSIVPLNLSSSPPPPLAFSSPHRPLPIDPSLPMNPTYYQQ
ncbi:hypothetical protein M0805_007794 [Coniferiporia weirii]|nr:hypothetical protein M0805_007794 [Coniferiporia weirii]